MLFILLEHHFLSLSKYSLRPLEHQEYQNKSNDHDAKVGALDGIEPSKWWELEEAGSGIEEAKEERTKWNAFNSGSATENDDHPSKEGDDGLEVGWIEN